MVFKDCGIPFWGQIRNTYGHLVVFFFFFWKRSVTWLSEGFYWKASGKKRVAQKLGQCLMNKSSNF